MAAGPGERPRRARGDDGLAAAAFPVRDTGAAARAARRRAAVSGQFLLNGESVSRSRVSAPVQYRAGAVGMPVVLRRDVRRDETTSLGGQGFRRAGRQIAVEPTA